MFVIWHLSINENLNGQIRPKIYSLWKITQDERKKSSKFISIQDLKIPIKIISHKRTLDPEGFTWEFFQVYKEEKSSILQYSFRK